MKEYPNEKTKSYSPIDNSQNPVIRLRGWIDLESAFDNSKSPVACFEGLGSIFRDR